MFRLLHLADLHLGWAPSNLPPDLAVQRRSRRDSVLRRAVDEAITEGVDVVVIAGDLFETHRPAGTLVEEVLAQLRRLDEKGIVVITTPGNHDEVTYADSVYRQRQGEWPGLLVLEPYPRKIAAVPVRGSILNLYSVAYTGGVTPVARPLSELPAAEGDGFHLGVFHGTLGPAQERSLPLDREALRQAGYDYVAMGHIHLPSVERIGGSTVVYSGCNEGKGFDDPGVPYLTVVTAGQGQADVERLPFPVQEIRVHDLDLGDLADPSQLDEAIEAKGDPEALVRFTLRGMVNFQLDPDLLQARHGSRFRHLEVRDETDGLAVELLDLWANERTIRGSFVRRLQARLQDARDDEERQLVMQALRLGMRALRGAA